MKPIVVERKTRMPESQGGGLVTRHLYWCPGCDNLHGIVIQPGKQANGASWSFEGSLECPTYSPSQLTQFEGGPPEARQKFVCHTFIRGGMIQFLGDCTHELRGQTVPMVPVPDWLIQEGEQGADE